MKCRYYESRPYVDVGDSERGDLADLGERVPDRVVGRRDAELHQLRVANWKGERRAD